MAGLFDPGGPPWHPDPLLRPADAGAIRLAATGPAVRGGHVRTTSRTVSAAVPPARPRPAPASPAALHDPPAAGFSSRSSASIPAICSFAPAPPPSTTQHPHQRPPAHEHQPQSPHATANTLNRSKSRIPSGVSQRDHIIAVGRLATPSPTKFSYAIACLTSIRMISVLLARRRMSAASKGCSPSTELTRPGVHTWERTLNRILRLTSTIIFCRTSIRPMRIHGVSARQRGHHLETVAG